MKIIFSNYDDIKNPYYAGGGAIAIHEITKRLSKSNQITVLNSKHPLAKNDEIIEGVYYKRIGFGIFGAKVDQIIYSLLLLFYVRKERYDLWVETFVPPISGSLLPIFSSKPVVGLAFFLDADMMRKKYLLPFDILERKILKNYKYFIATSTHLCNKIKITNNKAQITTIPLGFERSMLDIKTREKNYILFLGRLDIFNKGLDILLKIAPEILSKFPSLKIVIAGQGIESQEKWLKDRISKLHLEKKVLFTGRVSKDKKYKLMSECLLYVLPSRYETFGISVLEALALGKLTIVFDIPGFTWIPEDVCIKIKAFDERELLNQIISFSKNPKLRKETGYRARDFTKQFSWENIAAQYEKYITGVYDESIKKNNL